jgi:hypothetical protein
VKRNGRTLLAAVCCLMFILLAGCAALSSITAKRESLEERVKNYMQAQIDRKWDRAYTFLDRSSRENMTRESYVSRTRKTSNTGFTIGEVTMLPSGDQATVKVRMDISYMGFNFKAVSQTQNWVKERGEWFIKWSGNNAPLPQQQKQQ